MVAYENRATWVSFLFFFFQRIYCMQIMIYEKRLVQCCHGIESSLFTLSGVVHTAQKRPHHVSSIKGRLQEVENNGKLYNHQANTWSRLFMGGDRLREVVVHGGSTVL